ncbi:hypothetical protein EI94DRAFT_1788181 [Lactarius quietus]|nr:hypothetical protein EI94DRAFT_1788181 [Lactarius quietus]
MNCKYPPPHDLVLRYLTQKSIAHIGFNGDLHPTLKQKKNRLLAHPLRSYYSHKKNVLSTSKADSARLVRFTLIFAFREVVGKGYLEIADNPAFASGGFKEKQKFSEVHGQVWGFLARKWKPWLYRDDLASLCDISSGSNLECTKKISASAQWVLCVPPDLTFNFTWSDLWPILTSSLSEL